MAKFFCLFCVILLIGCAENPSWEIIEIENPSGDNSGESFLHVDEDWNTYLSWIDLKDDTLSQLQFAHLKDDQFSSPKTIAEGADWFVNWADFPSITKFPNHNKLLVHWLQKSANGTYDYDVRISSSEDNGNSWSDSKVLHNDGIAAEHGFVSIIPYKDNLIATWLDGRQMKSPSMTDDDEHGHGHGAMTLRTAQIGSDNSITNRIELDDEVCECCQTDIAITQDGPIIVYRNKSEDGIRDVYFTRAIGDDWTIPRAVYEDDWKISGCPVNGPRIDTRENRVAIAWYSGADQKVKVVSSEDNGKTFSKPIIINNNETIGRVDVAYVGQEDFVVSYMEPKEELAAIKLVNVNHKQGKTHELKIAETSSSRSSGFPRLAINKEGIYVSYTYVDSTYQQIKTKLVTI